jgi:hypothetical protein
MRKRYTFGAFKADSGGNPRAVSLGAALRSKACGVVALRHRAEREPSCVLSAEL